MSSLNTILRPRLCELGKIKIGGKDAKVRTTAGGGTWRAPVKYDYFVITTMHRDAAGNLVRDAQLMEALGTKYADPDGKLRQVPITVLSDEPEDIMQSAWVWYGSKRIAARSDGETVTWFADPGKMKLLDEPRTEPWKPEFAELKDAKGDPLFKLHSVFNCVIASGESRWGGVYKLRTTSRITADQLYGSLIHLRQLTSGILRGLPLMLVVRPMEVTPRGKATTIYVVHVELHGADLQAVQRLAQEQARYQLSNVKQMQAIQLEYRRLLQPPGENESPVEIADIQEEFHPPSEPTGDAAPEGADPLAEKLGLDGAGNGGAEPTDTAPTLRQQLDDALATDAGKQAFFDLFGDATLPDELDDEQIGRVLQAAAGITAKEDDAAQGSLLP